MGLDAHQTINERERYFEARMRQGIREHEDIDKQRDMRAQVSHSTMLPLHRLDFRRTRKPTIPDPRMTEQLERKQRLERERRAKHKHVQQLSVICSHGRDVIVSLKTNSSVWVVLPSTSMLMPKKKNRSVLRDWLKSV